jgi:hypothetical protein
MDLIDLIDKNYRKPAESHLLNNPSHAKVFHQIMITKSNQYFGFENLSQSENR